MPNYAVAVLVPNWCIVVTLANGVTLQWTPLEYASALLSVNTLLSRGRPLQPIAAPGLLRHLP